MLNIIFLDGDAYVRTVMLSQHAGADAHVPETSKSQLNANSQGPK